MRTIDQIPELLALPEGQFADDLDDKDLDFKGWNARSIDDYVKLVIGLAVCMAKGGGAWAAPAA